MSDRELDDEEMAALVRAAGLSCDRSTISRIRRGKSQPSWQMASCLKRITKGRVSADDFLAEARA